MCIDSALTAGYLTYGECVIPGTSTDEFLIFTHVCHPSLCNDNLTGIALTAILAQVLKNSPQALHLPIGICAGHDRFDYLAGRVTNRAHVACDTVSCLGCSAIAVRSRTSAAAGHTAEIDQIASYVLPRVNRAARLVDFSPYGYDERQLCSPGFDLPVGRLTRTPNNEYPEYHSSADDFSHPGC